ncbi:hypothetical protein BJX64DRAFT_293647 [Aspergillus heterothallicus]
MPSLSIHWQETAPGFYSRELDEAEIFYRRCKRKESGCFPVTSSASFTIGDSTGQPHFTVEDAFRKAWVTLRYRHPTLASRVEHDDDSGRWTRVYSVVDGQGKEINDWLCRTFTVIQDEGESDALKWFNWDAPDFEHASVYLVRPMNDQQRQRWAIFLRCPHDVTDGIGVLHLLDQLVEFAAQALEQGSDYRLPTTWGDEGARLSPCLRVAAEIQARNAGLYSHAHLLGLPPSSRGRTVSLTSRRERLALSVPKATTAQILHRCKALGAGISVTHVFTAALAIVLAQLHAEQHGQDDADSHVAARYVNHSMINLRRYCQPPYNGPDHAAAAYHTISAQAMAIDVAIPDHVGAAEAWVEALLPQVASQVRDFFTRIRPTAPSSNTIDDGNDNNCPDHLAFTPTTFKSITPPPGTDAHHIVSDPPFCPVPLSSLGNISHIVEKNHGVFELDDVWAASEPIGAGVAVFLGTWEGALEPAAVFDTRYHGRVGVEGFLRRIVKCVCKGLGVEF